MTAIRTPSIGALRRRPGSVVDAAVPLARLRRLLARTPGPVAAPRAAAPRPFC